MPARWEGQKTVPSHAAVARQPSKLVPPPTLKERAFRSQTAPLQPTSSSRPRVKPESTTASKQRIRTNNHHNTTNNDDRGYWQSDDFDNNLTGLGIHNNPSPHYELRRGKTEPLPATSDQHLELISPTQDSPRRKSVMPSQTALVSPSFGNRASSLTSHSPGSSPPLDSHDLSAPPVQQPPPRNPRRLNPHDWRPASSVYVDDPAAHRDLHAAPSPLRTPAKDMYRRPPALDISPPSSPELSAGHYGKYSHDVSPIDDGPDHSHHHFFYGGHKTPSPRNGSLTNLGSMRQPKHAGQDKKLREARSADRLRDPHADAVHPWDSSPRLGEYPNAPQAFGLTTTVTGPQVHRSGNAPQSLGQRMRNLTRGKTETIENRPPWKGASGRAPMVEPIKDDLTVAPLSVQRKPSKMGNRSGSGQPETSNTSASTVRRLLPSRSNQKLKEAAKTPSPEPSSHGPSAHAYPTPPHHHDSPPSSQSQAPASLPPPNFPSQNKAIRRKPSPSTHNPPHDPHKSTTSVYSAYTDATVASFVPHLETNEPSSPFTSDDPWVPPPSRFSVTTCNTTQVDSPQLPAEEEQPPMPPPPKQISVMDRRRPVPGGEKSPTSDPIVISMKSNFGASAGIGLGRLALDRSASIASTTKALPPSPMEKESASDRVAFLNARLENLAHRRLNINRSIRQMTELMPLDSLMSSADILRKREMEKKKVDGLKEELAEIQREEYDLGLKLFRAHKRLERESDFESSALWIRRATEE